MRAQTIDKLVWILVYGGLLAVGLGLAVQRREAALGWALAAGGVVVAVIGAALVVVRSRMKAGPGQ